MVEMCVSVIDFFKWSKALEQGNSSDIISWDLLERAVISDTAFLAISGNSKATRTFVSPLPDLRPQPLQNKPAENSCKLTHNPIPFAVHGAKSESPFYCFWKRIQAWSASTSWAAVLVI